MGFTVATALQIYYVQEMLAALILFAVLFSAVAAVLLILYVLFRAADALLEVLESSAKHALQHARAWRTLPAESRSVLRNVVSAHVGLTTSHLAPSACGDVLFPAKRNAEFRYVHFWESGFTAIMSLG